MSPSHLNILILSSSAKATGGAEKIALDSAVRLARRGHRVTVAAAHGPIPSELSGVENLRILVADPEPLPERLPFTQRVKMVWPERMGQFVQTLIQEFESVPDSLIHFHSGYFDFSVPGFRRLAKANLPIFYTHHDFAWACPLTGFYDYSRSCHCELTGGSAKCLVTDCTNSSVEKLIRFSRHFGTHQTSGIGGAVDHHFFVSETSRAKLAPYISNDVSQSVLYNGSDRVQAPRSASTEDAPLIFVGRLTHEKDPLAFAEAAKEAEMPAAIVGDGPLFIELQEKGFAKLLAGWQEPVSVDRLIASSRALVMTSRWMETAGLVIQEASSRGVPSVVPRDTAAAEFVEHEVTGLHYDRDDPNSLSSAMRRLCDLSFANQLGTEAYARFWSNPPTWHRHMDELVSVYRRVLSASPNH